MEDALSELSSSALRERDGTCSLGRSHEMQIPLFAPGNDNGAAKSGDEPQRHTMTSPPHIPRYNQPIPHMRARASSGLRIGFPHSHFLVLLRMAALFFWRAFLPSSLFASNLGDTARQLADRIAAASGPGALSL